MLGEKVTKYAELRHAMHAALRTGQTAYARLLHAQLCRMEAALSAEKAAKGSKWQGGTRWK